MFDRKWLKNLLENPYVGGFLKLFSGSLSSQIVSVLAVFGLAYFYDPVSFGHYEIVVVTSALIASVLGLRYEMALMLPRQHKVGLNIFYLSLSLSAVLIVVISVLLLTGNYLFKLTTQYIIILSLGGGWGLFLINTAILWNNRLEDFGKSAFINLVRSVVLAGIQFSLISISTGLSMGYSIGLLACGLFFTIQVLVKEKVFQSWSSRLMRYSFRRYLSFSLYNIPSAFINTLANAVPSYFIPAFYSKYELGLFALLKRIVLGPVQLIAGSLNNVVYQQFTKEIAHGRSVLPAFKKIIKNMAIASTVVVILLTATLQLNVFDLILTDEWRRIGVLLYYLLPALFFGFLAKSVARFAIYERTDIGLYFQIFLLLVTTAVFGISWGWTFEMLILVYSIAQSVIFLLQLFISYRLSKQT